MAEERKQYLKEKIFNDVKLLIDDSEYSLEELEDCAALLDNMMTEMEEEFVNTQENIHDK